MTPCLHSSIDSCTHPLTPTLSPVAGGEGANCPVYRKRESELPPLPLAGEGWGEGVRQGAMK